MPEDKDELTHQLQAMVGRLFAFGVLCQGAHWNVTGPRFLTLHAFFGELYTDVFGAIDRFAESCRQHDCEAPGSLAAVFDAAGQAGEHESSSRAETLIAQILGANAAVMEALNEVGDEAEGAGDFGLANYCQERLAVHLKWDWMLRVQQDT